MPKVSVIIPTYKATETIRKTLASISMQSIAEELEVIIVNDCDGLSYSQIIRDFSDLDIKYVIREKNGGCGASRNTGIEKATGCYIVFIDSDDQLEHPLALEVMSNEIGKAEADLLVASFESEMRDKDGIAIKKISGSPTWCHAKMYRRQYIMENNLRFKEYLRINEDVEFHQVYMDLGAKVVKIPLVTYLWRDNAKSLTHESVYKNKEWFVRAVAEYLRDCAERGLSGDRVTKRAVQNLVVVYQYANVVADDHPERLDDYMTECHEYWKLAAPIVSEVDDKYATEIYCEIMKDFNYVPVMTFPQFLQELQGD